MLAQHASIKIYDDVSGSGREVLVTPLFLQNQHDPWQPNEIFDVAEAARLTAGTWEPHTEPVSLCKIIVNDKKEWRFEGENNLTDDELKEIAGFVLDGE
ncbi:hypothetical protein ACFGVR_14655 [Mucilaginibacter sp. AW1-3]